MIVAKAADMVSLEEELSDDTDALLGDVVVVRMLGVDAEIPSWR